MIPIALAGFYSISQACKELSTKDKDIYPENLLRLVSTGALTLYCEVDEQLAEIARPSALDKLDYSFGKHHFASFEIPTEWLSVIINSYERWRDGPQYSGFSEHFDALHWFPEKIRVFETQEVVYFDTGSLTGLQLHYSSALYFHSSDLNKLIGISPETDKLVQAKPLEIPAQDYISALRMLAERKAGPIPEKSISESYKRKLLEGYSKKHESPKPSDEVNVWTNQLVKYHYKGLKKASDSLKENLRFLAVTIAGPFPEHSSGFMTPDEEWTNNLIQKLNSEQQCKFTAQQWLELLKG